MTFHYTNDSLLNLIPPILFTRTTIARNHVSNPIDHATSWNGSPQL